MFQPQMQLSAADVKRIVGQDDNGHATRAIIHCLRCAAAPLAQALSGSLSPEEQRLSRELIGSIEQAERSLASAWEQRHPGQRL